MNDKNQKNDWHQNGYEKVAENRERWNYQNKNKNKKINECHKSIVFYKCLFLSLEVVQR